MEEEKKVKCEKNLAKEKIAELYHVNIMKRI